MVDIPFTGDAVYGISEFLMLAAAGLIIFMSYLYFQEITLSWNMALVIAFGFMVGIAIFMLSLGSSLRKTPVPTSAMLN